MTYLERQLRRLERRVSDLEERLNQPTNPSEAWLRKMADAEDQAGSVFAGCPPCDVNADLESGFGELQRKLDAGEAIVSTSGDVLVKKRPVVNPCRKCGKRPRTIATISTSGIDSDLLPYEISCCGETAIGGRRDETVECWNKRNPAAKPPSEQREWWVAVWKNTGRGFAFESKEAADFEASIHPDCVKIFRVMKCPTFAERNEWLCGQVWYQSAAEAVKCTLNHFFGRTQA